MMLLFEVEMRLTIESIGLGSGNRLEQTLVTDDHRRKS